MVHYYLKVENQKPGSVSFQGWEKKSVLNINCSLWRKDFKKDIQQHKCKMKLYMGQQFKGQFCGQSVEFTLSKYNSFFFSVLLHCHSHIHDCPFFLVTYRLALHIALCDNNGKKLTYFRRRQTPTNYCFSEKCSFLQVWLQLFLFAHRCLCSYFSSSQKDLELASRNTPGQLSLQAKGNKVKLTSHTCLTQLNLLHNHLDFGKH